MGLPLLGGRPSQGRRLKALEDENRLNASYGDSVFEMTDLARKAAKVPMWLVAILLLPSAIACFLHSNGDTPEPG
jgi:hypothetical protein